MEQKTFVLNGNKLDSTWSDSTIPFTENTTLDKLFIEFPRFKHLKNRLILLNVELNAVDYSNKKIGYGNTRAQAGLIGNLGDGKYVIDFDPARTTVLDILHEKHHIIQFQRLAKSNVLGNKKPIFKICRSWL